MTNPATATTAIKLKEEGDVYVSSNGNVYTAPRIDTDKLRNYKRNYYGAGVTRQLLALFFAERYKLVVKGPDGKPDEDLQKEIEAMAAARDVSLWNKMRMDWIDRLWFGAAIFNPVWEKEGSKWILRKVRRLPPESFGQPATTETGTGTIYGDILRGIFSTTDGEIRAVQTDSDGVQTELTNFKLITDPTSTEIAGEPGILPLVPILTMLDYTWKSQMQTINRIGAPILFIKIAQPKGDDVAYAQKVLKSWGKDTAFVLRENMELIEYTTKEGTVTADTIDRLAKMVLNYWTTTSMITTEGNTLGGSSASELDLLYTYIAGVHRETEAAWEELLQEYLDVNGYAGYTVDIRIPDPQPDKSELKIKQAETGIKAGALDLNEIRILLGHDERSEEELAKLPGYHAQKSAPLQADQNNPTEGQGAGQPGGPRQEQTPGRANIAPSQKSPANRLKMAPQNLANAEGDRKGYNPVQDKQIEDLTNALTDAIDAMAEKVFNTIL